MAIRNMMEDIVAKVFREMESHRPEIAGLPPSQKDDMMAIALNRLPPRYTTTERGEVLAKIQSRAQLESDAFRELLEAYRIVAASPRS